MTEPKQRPSIAIIGAGKVGTAIGVLATRSGYRVTAVADRDRRCAEEAARRIGTQVPVLPAHGAASRAELVLLAVPDDAIEATCRELAAARAFGRGALVAHCSGALSSECLSTAREELACHVASFHPLQSFPTVEVALASLPGSYCFGEGDEPALAALEALGSAIGARCVRIDTEHKPLYHAAAVMACNYLTGLMDAALGSATAARIERPTTWQALEPLIRATVDNISKLGPEAALTGPIVRGDHGVVTAHLAALDRVAPELADLYRALGRWTLGLALRKGTLDEAAAHAVREVLVERVERDAG